MDKFQSIINLTADAALFVQNKATEIATIGGCQAKGVREIASNAGKTLLEKYLNSEQKDEIQKFIHQKTCVVIFNNLYDKNIDNSIISIPSSLPKMEELEENLECLKLAASNQILLATVEQFAFAYDIDNHGKIMRLVGNFKGGGATKLENEDASKVDKSSHSGIALGAHTEAPYHAATKIFNNHSPAPSSLVLTARYNPLSEPTTVIPLQPILEKLHYLDLLALTTENFDFTRSETFTSGKGTGGSKVSILEFNNDGIIGVKYNSYRFTANVHAPQSVKDALNRFNELINNSEQYKINLQPNTCMIINNTLALHCRDVIQDNRRLLIRIFGYKNNIEYISLEDDPVLAQG